MLSSYQTSDSLCVPLEQQLDLASLAVDVKKILARGELWQLKAECTMWMEEWNLLKLSDVTCQVIHFYLITRENEIATI